MNAPRAVRWGRALYRALIVPLHPALLRTRYGDAMEAAFRDQLDEAVRRHGWVGWTRVLTRTVRGALGARLREMMTARPQGGPARGGGGVDIRSEFRQAARRLRRSPGFTAVTVLTLTLGVGAFASVFGVTAGVLLAPLPYDDPDELVWLWRDYWGDFPRGWLSGVDIDRLQGVDAFEGVAAFRTARLTLTDDDGSAPREVEAILGSPGYFDLIGIEPARGPGFSPVDFAPDAPDEVILSHTLWASEFGGDPTLVGRDVQVDGSAYRVVGVLPDGADFQMHSSLAEPRGADLWFVLDVDLSTANPYAGQYAGLARIGDGVTEAEMETALARVSESIDAESFDSRGLRIWPVGLKADLVSDATAPLVVLVGAAGFLLLILGANLATPFLARTEDRLLETSVRSALGASRSATATTTLLEPLLVAVAGLSGGLLLAAWATPALAYLAREVLPRTTEIGFDRYVVGGGATAAVIVVALAAAGPLGRALLTGPLGGLREGGRSGAGRRAVRARSALVVTQVSLALALVVGAGLLTRSLQSLLAQDPGYDPGSAITFRVSFRGPAFDDDQRLSEAQELLRRRLVEEPGIAGAGYVGALPLSMETDQTSVRFPGAPGNTGDDEEDALQADIFNISEGYLAAAGLRLIEGREPRVDAFAPAEARAREVVVDDVVAARFFPSGGAVGGSIVFNGDTTRIVGVVDQARLYAVERDDRGQVYVPAPAWSWSSVSFVVRPVEGSDPQTLPAALRTAVASFDAGLPVEDIRPLGDDVDAALGSERLNLGLASAFALTALVLAVLGVYGVVAGTVARRRREIGVRMAMGADGRRIVRMVLARGIRLGLLGVMFGLGLAALTGRWLSALLYGVAPFDPTTYGVAALTLAAAAVAASWLPARRASRVTPREALRGE